MKTNFLGNNIHRKTTGFKFGQTIKAIATLVIIISCYISLIAAPSGGPYGPIQKNYNLPSVSGKIYYVAPDGNPQASGLKLNTPTTIESVIERVKTGDAIILRGGTYRTGNLVLNQGISMQPYQDEKVTFKGTWVAKDWQNIHRGLWKIKWDRLFPNEPLDWWRYDWEARFTPMHRFNNDVVFVDGKFLQAVGWLGEVTDSTYFINYEKGAIYIGADPSKHTIEITAYNSAITRTTGEAHGKKSDGKGPIIRGIHFDQYARLAFEIEGTEPQGPAKEENFGKKVVGTTLEHCTISNCSRVAGYFRGDSLTIRHCEVYNTSTEGIYIIASNDVLLEKNILRKNNIERITGYYPSAVKIFNQSHRVVCRDNLVTDLPYSNGIWYDVGNVDGVFINNWVENVGFNDDPIPGDRIWPVDNGFYFEISKGVTCAGNVFVNCDRGLSILNSCDAHIYNNTFVNSMASVARTDRSAEGDHFGWHPATGPGVEERDGHIFANNLLVSTDMPRPLSFVWQPDFMCDRLPQSQLKQMDHNIYVRTKDSQFPLMLWSPANEEDCQAEINSLEQLQKMFPNLTENSSYHSDYKGPLFKSVDLKNLQLLPDFPGNKTGMQLPPEVKDMIDLKGEKTYIGAYPLLP
ncbi:MAG: right-handed parallel beta-helix repeat-containing protein [Candidatus Marinimicrobia bacterium]|nr:right-handed parallel beta-helix repeat-containing protein [Candidatus Neomarinimicrobiota bacterium]